MPDKEINKADFVNMANRLVGAGLLATGFANFKLAQELAEQQSIAFFKWNAAKVLAYTNKIVPHIGKELEEVTAFENSTIEQRYQLFIKQ